MEQEINRAVEVLRRGGVILYPTDTIWGIGCDARNAAAVERLYAVKERDHTKSMLVLIRKSEVGGQSFLSQQNLSDLRGVPSARPTTPTSELSRPTTYILPRERWQPLLGDSVAPNLPAADGSLGVRVPDHPFCQEVLRRLGAPLVSTSANLSGRPSPQSYDDIEEALKRRVDYCVPPLPAFLTAETRGSRIVKVNPDGSETVIRP